MITIQSGNMIIPKEKGLVGFAGGSPAGTKGLRVSDADSDSAIGTEGCPEVLIDQRPASPRTVRN